MTTRTHPTVEPALVEPALVERPPPPRATGWQKAVGILGLVVLFWVGDRLSEVISRGDIGPGGDHGPAGPTPTSQPVNGERLPSGSDLDGGHDPSQFDH